MENFGKFSAVVLIMIISPVVNGYVLSKLYGWFIVTTFEMEPLRLIEAIGILYIVSFIRLRADGDTEKDFTKYIVKKMAFLIAAAVLYLVTGYIVHLFI